MSQQSNPPQQCVTQKIPYVGSHGAIVVGKGGSTAKALKGEFCLSMLRAFRDDDGSQYFIVKGFDERGVNHATIRIQELLLTSMARGMWAYEYILDTERCAHEVSRDQLLAMDQNVIHQTH